MTRPLPSFAKMMQSYPNFDSAAEVFSLIGGMVEANHFSNSCVIRVSRALNYAGDPVRLGRGAHVVSGKDQKWYAYRVAEFVTYMKNEYGPPTVVARAPHGRPPTTKTAFMGKRGVIAFKVAGWNDATGHFDLWDRDHCIHDEYFGQSFEVLLWQAPP